MPPGSNLRGSFHDRIKIQTQTGWDGPDLDRGAERRAADLSLKILKNLEQVFLQTYETQTSPDWIYDLGGMDSQSAAFCFTALAKVKCASRFTTAKSKFAKRPFPDCGYWKLGRLKASLRPCCLVQSKRPFQTEPIALKSLKNCRQVFCRSGHSRRNQ